MMRVLLVIATAVLLSCVSTVTYKTDYPPIDLPKDVNEVTIVHRIDSTFDAYSKDEKNAVYHQAYSIFVEKLHEDLHADRHFSVTNEVWIEDIERSSKEMSTYHSMEDIQSIRPQTNADLLLVIEDFSIDQSRGFSVNSDNDDPNRKYTTLISKANLTLLSADNQRIDRQLVMATNQVDRGIFEELPGVLVGTSLQGYREMILPLSHDLVTEYLSAFYPRSKEVTRQVYSGKRFKGLADLINSAQYDKAEDLVFPQTKSTDLDVKKQSTYNMFVLCEAEGRHDEAQKWLSLYERFLDGSN